MVHQLTRNLSVDQIKGTPFEAYYVDHTTGIWPQAAGGIPFNACEFQSKGDAITDLVEDLAAEQKARSTYDNLSRCGFYVSVKSCISSVSVRHFL